MNNKYIPIIYSAGPATSDLKEWGILTYDAQVMRLARLSTTQDATNNPDAIKDFEDLQKTIGFRQAQIMQEQDSNFQQGLMPRTRWTTPSTQIPVLLKPQDPSPKE